MSVVFCAYVSCTLPVYLWGVLRLDDMTRGPRPLIDHATTVSAYLKDYNKSESRQIGDVISRKFSCYLLSTCWEKILRRVQSWEAKGFIHFLTTIRVNNLQYLVNSGQSFPSGVGEGDKSLMDVLSSLQKHDLIDSLILDHILSKSYLDSQTQTRIEKLLSISDSKVLPLLSKETTVEFHQLVIGAFRGFANTFLGIKAEYSKLVCLDFQALEM